MSISHFKAGLWEGRLDVPGMQVHLPSREKQLRFETRLQLSGRAVASDHSTALARPGSSLVPFP